jgi:transcriptional regulator, gntR family
MIFICNKTIYEQVYDHFCEDIIKGTYKVDDRIPSIREFAVMLQVNPNTVVKAFKLLSFKKIIYKRRGLGYFVSSAACEQIITVRLKTFLIHSLPSIFREMNLLGITMEDFEREWLKYNNK